MELFCNVRKQLLNQHPKWRLPVSFFWLLQWHTMSLIYSLPPVVAYFSKRCQWRCQNGGSHRKSRWKSRRRRCFVYSVFYSCGLVRSCVLVEVYACFTIIVLFFCVGWLVSLYLLLTSSLFATVPQILFDVLVNSSNRPSNRETSPVKNSVSWLPPILTMLTTNKDCSMVMHLPLKHKPQKYTLFVLLLMLFSSLLLLGYFVLFVGLCAVCLFCVLFGGIETHSAGCNLL